MQKRGEKQREFFQDTIHFLIFAAFELMLVKCSVAQKLKGLSSKGKGLLAWQNFSSLSHTSSTINLKSCFFLLYSLAGTHPYSLIPQASFMERAEYANGSLTWNLGQKFQRKPCQNLLKYQTLIRLHTKQQSYLLSFILQHYHLKRDYWSWPALLMTS